MGVQETLADRHKRYGRYGDVAITSQCLQAVMQSAKNWDAMPADMRESLQMMASKMARVLNGDMECVDSWHDLQGYARLIEERLLGRA